MSYTMNYHHDAQEAKAPGKQAEMLTPSRHLVVAQGLAPIKDKGVVLYVDPETEFYITGTIMDFISNPTEEKFEFLNPNAKAVCGCNESFTV